MSITFALVSKAMPNPDSNDLKDREETAARSKSHLCANLSRQSLIDDMKGTRAATKLQLPLLRITCLYSRARASGEFTRARLAVIRD